MHCDHGEAGEPVLEPRERIRGTLLGLAVADALGAPLEFESAERAGRAAEDGLEMSGGRMWAAGEWTDDTAMALCLAESIADRGLLDLDDLARRYVEWASSGPKDIGITTGTALRGAKDAAGAREQAKRLHDQSGQTAGNGTIMRVAPIALATTSRSAAAGHAREEAPLTHFDPAAGAASAALCAALLAIMAGDDPIAAADRETAGHERLAEAVEAAREHDLEKLAALAAGQERGTCWTTLGVALYALEAIDDYERGVTWAISLGGDTDTNAAVAGALLGCRHGVDAIPGRWLAPLRERERIEQAARALAERRGG